MTGEQRRKMCEATAHSWGQDCYLRSASLSPRRLRGQVPKDAKVVVACQKGLRWGAAGRARSAAGRLAAGRRLLTALHVRVGEHA